MITMTTEAHNLLWGIDYHLGDEPANSIIASSHTPEFMKMNLMISSFMFHNKAFNYKKLQSAGIRKFLGLNEYDPRRIMVDSGGFKGYSCGIDVKIPTVLDVYDKMGLHNEDFAINLDEVPLVTGG